MPQNRLAAHRYGGAYLLEAGVLLGLYAALRVCGYARSVPWTLLIAVVAGFTACHQPWTHLRLSGGDLHRRVVARLALQVGAMAVVLHLVGWGPLLGMMALATVAQAVTWSGSAAWRPAVAIALVATALGQLALAAGWVHTYLSGRLADATAAIAAGALLLGGRSIGLAAARHEHAEAELRRSEERFRALVQDSADVVSVIGPDRTIAYTSPAVERVMGYRPEELTGTSPADHVHPGDLDTLGGLLSTLQRCGDEPQRVEVRARHADGTWHWHEANARNLLDHPAVGGIVVNHRDITARRAIQDRLTYETSHDQLTDVANRTAFLHRLERVGTLAALGDRRLGVLVLGLDGLKQVNDALGHGAGDQLLIAVSGALRHCLLGADLVGRIGGDEFAVALTDISSRENLVRVAKRLLAELDKPVFAGRNLMQAQVSIGLALSTPECRGPMELLTRATVAMYHAKRGGQHGYQVYAEGMSDRAEAGAPCLEDDLRLAVAGGQLRLQYQPIVSLERGELVGVEALVRWEHPERGWMPPQTFIPLAEATGLIVPIGAWVLERACEQVQEWQRRRPASPPLSLNVNLSPRQLCDESLIDNVRDTLWRTGFDPRNLVLEVTESALVDYETSVPRLEALNGQGIRVALDDFGTGYSSLRYLTRLPVDILKLDQCFVAELNGTSEGCALADAVVRLGQSLHLETIAEGIEHPTQAVELSLLGYTLGQGFLYSRPLHACDIDALIGSAGAGSPVLPAATSVRR